MVLLLGGSIVFYVAFSLPVTQRLLGRTASSVLTSLFGSQVTINAIDASMPWRPVLDGVTVLDQRGDTLLGASRMATRINLWQALHERYRLSHVQLYCPDIRLVQDTAGVLNCQHIIDALSSDGGGGNGTDLQIASILVRRGSVSYAVEREDSAAAEPLRLSNLALTVYGLTLQEKVLRAHLHDMHVTTPYGDVENLSGTVQIGPDEGVLTDIVLTLPYSRVAFGKARWVTGFDEWDITGGKAALDVRDIPQRIGLSSTLTDILDRVGTVNMSFAANGTRETAEITRMVVRSDHLNMDALANMRFSPLMVDVEQLDMSVQDDEYVRNPLLLSLTGRYDDGDAQARAHVTSDMITASVDAVLEGNNRWQVDLRVTDAKPVRLLSFLPSMQPTLSMFGDSAHINVDAHADGYLKTAAWAVRGEAECRTLPLAATIKGAASHSVVMGTQINAIADVKHVRPSQFGIDNSIADKTYALSANAKISWPANGTMVDNANGRVEINDLTVLDDSIAPSPLIHWALVDVDDASDGDGRKVLLRGDFIDGHALVKGAVGPKMDMNLTVQVTDARAINYLANTEIEICKPVIISVNNNSALRVEVKTDSIQYGNERLTAVKIKGEYSAERGGEGSVTLHRHLKDEIYQTLLSVSMVDKDIRGLLAWDVTDLQGVLKQNNRGMVEVHAMRGDTTFIAVQPSTVVLDGTEWRFNPSYMKYMPDGALQIDRFAVESGDRYLRLQGRMSKDSRDTLRAELRDVNLGYIFDLVNFDDVDFDGDATGTIQATGLTSSPKADGRLHVRDFSFNHAVLGDLDLLAGWDTDDGQLNLDGTVTGPGVLSFTDCGQQVAVNTRIVGRVNPGKSNPRSGLDLNVHAQGFNLGFLREWTDDIFSDLNGAVSGDVRIYGPFNRIDLSGDLMIDHCTARVPTLNVYYQLGGDSVHIRPATVDEPGKFIFDGVRISDRAADVSRRGTVEAPGKHTAVVHGALSHRHFKRMTYDFTARTNNILGYDEREFKDQSFYGTAYLTGNVHLTGGAGRLNVEVDGNTEAGSQLVYNSTTPDALTHSDFITFVDGSANTHGTGLSIADNQHTSMDYNPPVGTDIHLDFDVAVTADATLRVLMDARTEDYVELNGTSPSIKVNYYNKGSLAMFGTYTVQRGEYRMTLQGLDLVNRRFKFSNGGTISFSGAPMQAVLDLQAVYNGPRVNLNDLTAGNTFSATRVPVDCLLNLTNTVSAPKVSFDFALPQSTPDEEAMVRSLVSTEEERNLQAIYLLGLNSFYVQDQVVEGQTRGGMAMNSLLSSTLSSTLSNIVGDAIGNRNWSVGTNISTGQEGWSEVQAETSLSGRLLNDRLLLNGTFGYRDGGKNPAQTGFIGDFDMQWLLTPTGTLSVKGYSQTTDRYFTKSSLTTQGIGLLLKKDFNTLWDLFNMKKKKK